MLTRLVERCERATVRQLSGVIAGLVMLVMLGLISHGHYAASGDAIHYMVIAQSLAFDRDFDVRNNYDDHSSIIDLPAGGHARIGQNGVLRPVHDVGMPLVAAPFYAVAYKLAEASVYLPATLREWGRISPFIALRQLISSGMIVLTAVLAIVFFRASLDITGQKTLSFAWTCLWALSPPVLTHGYVFFTEIPTALIALSIYQARGYLLTSKGWTPALLIGALTGFLFLIHARNIGLVVGLTIALLWSTRRQLLKAVSLTVGLLLMFSIRAALNFRFWGHVITTPHAHLGEWSGTASFLSEMVLRSCGLLFDTQHGLLPCAPIYLMAPAALIVFRRRSPDAAVFLLTPAATYLAFVLIPLINPYGWRGGWSPAARFLVPVVAFAALPIPMLFASKSGRRVMVIVVGLQLAVDALFWGYPMLTWGGDPGPSPLLEAFAGRDFAAWLPVWQTLTVPILSVSAILLLLWAAVTSSLIADATT